MSQIKRARTEFHGALLAGILRTDGGGVPSNADRASRASVAIAQSLVQKLGGEGAGMRLAGQRAGNQFEDLTREFIDATFSKLGHLRPGTWEVRRVGGRGRNAPRIAAFEQYAHLEDITEAIRLLVKTNPKLAASLSGDYTISPDVVIVRQPEPDERINQQEELVDENVARMSVLRSVNSPQPFLHASISCKWTLRSDRAQNARTEALNLMRNRKGRLPHVVVVTGEPLPTRLASLCMGTGDVDCVYHFALPELRAGLADLDFEEQAEMLESMVAGKRLKDISDLPLDLAV